MILHPLLQLTFLLVLIPEALFANELCLRERYYVTKNFCNCLEGFTGSTCEHYRVETKSGVKTEYIECVLHSSLEKRKNWQVKGTVRHSCVCDKISTLSGPEWRVCEVVPECQSTYQLDLADLPSKYSIGPPTCKCIRDWNGENCPIICGVHGHISNMTESREASCQCDSGYTGKYCDVVKLDSETESNPTLEFPAFLLLVVVVFYIFLPIALCIEKAIKKREERDRNAPRPLAKRFRRYTWNPSLGRRRPELLSVLQPDSESGPPFRKFSNEQPPYFSPILGPYSGFSRQLEPLEPSAAPSEICLEMVEADAAESIDETPPPSYAEALKVLTLYSV